MIKLHDVSLSYGQNTAEPVLHHVNLTVAKGELVLVCGESGCGKSSLLRLINGVAHTFCDVRSTDAMVALIGHSATTKVAAPALT